VSKPPGAHVCVYPLSDVLGYSSLSPKYQAYIAHLSTEYEPNTYKEAVKDPRWIKAMQSEIKALEDNFTWSVVDLPPSKKAIGCKWVYKIKYKATWEVERFKARLVAKGYNQKEGLDYQETFSPVVKMVTVRTVISIAAVQKWDIHQMDVYNAFLQGDLHEEVYMELPLGFAGDKGNQVCKLSKSLYGLKQASRQWNIKLTTALTNSGFIQSHLDYSLFTKRIDKDLVVVLVYVDDLLITGSNTGLIQETKDYLQHCFKIKDLGDLKYFLGIEFARSKDGILMHQRKYAVELISTLGFTGAKPFQAPMVVNKKLTSLEFDQYTQDDNDQLLSDPGEYQRLIGRLLYLTITRPDIAFVVQCLSQYMHSPKVSHMVAAARVVKYVKQSPGLGVFMSACADINLTAYCDADWASCVSTRRSVTGFLLKLGDSPISWKSKKQSTISRSSAEAEYRSLASTVAKLVWLRGLLSELGVGLNGPVTVFCDSKSAIQIATNLVFHERTKHIDIDCHFIREKVQLGLVKLLHIPTIEQQADILTKGLGIGQHTYLVSKLGMKNIFMAPSLRGDVEELIKCTSVP